MNALITEFYAQYATINPPTDPKDPPPEDPEKPFPHIPENPIPKEPDKTPESPPDLPEKKRLGNY